MLRCGAVLSALCVVAACTGPAGGQAIEPISVVDADGGGSQEHDPGSDAGGGGGVGGEGGVASRDQAAAGLARRQGADGVVSGDASDDEAEDSRLVTDAGADAGSGIDVTSVPDTITPAYVQAVLAELEALYAGALASHVAAGEPTLETTTKLGSAFAEPAYDGRLQHFIRIGREGFVEIADADRIRPRTHTDVRLLAVAEDCVYAETRLDVSPVRKDPRPLVESFVHLGPRDREIFDDVNPTPWLIHKMPGGDPEVLRELDPCAE